jgi:hypothetical protein
MNINEFSALCKALFRNEKGKPYKYVLLKSSFLLINIGAMFFTLFSNFFYDKYIIHPRGVLIFDILSA